MPPLLVENQPDSSCPNSPSTTWKDRFSALSNLVVKAQPVTNDVETLHESFASLNTSFNNLSYNHHASFNSSIGSIGQEEGEDGFNVDDALSAQQRLEASVLGIFLFLEGCGVDPELMGELVQMERQLQYTSLLKQAGEYTERIMMSTEEFTQKPDEVLNLFVDARSSLQEYSQDRYQQIRNFYRQYELQQWKEQVAKAADEHEEEWEESSQFVQPPRRRSLHDALPFQSQDRRTMLKRQSKRKLLTETKVISEEEAESLRDQLGKAMRFKMECQKQTDRKSVV